MVELEPEWWYLSQSGGTGNRVVELEPEWWNLSQNGVQASAQDSSGFIGNACYGTNHACDFYSLQCPQGEIIHLYNLIAGGKSEPLQRKYLCVEVIQVFTRRQQRTSSSTTAKPVTTIPVTTMGTPMKPRTTSAPLVNATEETTPVSAVVVAVPIACVLATMLAVSTAFFFKERRKRMEAENGNTNTSVRDRSVTRLQEFPSERVYDTIGETNTPEGNYNLGTRNLTNNLAHVYTESAPVAPVQQTNTDADISGQNCGYETLQHSPYQNTDTNGVPCSVYNQLTF
ncbi:hypothetical protein MAR_018215 [Mya arenaria]|uniref:Uncharacterized protein n=1 Tax=Mya arenaria TaxID=6604 RepID=A0ABY7EE06_MYAAR|nr:hypothetical protein MAR_018215 [Mya arenaria]